MTKLRKGVANTGGTLPIGTIVASILGTNSIPTGWLLCDGSPIPADYQELRTLIGSANTPNLIGRTLIGAGALSAAQTIQTDKRNPQLSALTAASALQIGDTGGECQHQLGIGEMPSHRHSINGGNFGLHHRSFEGSGDNDLPYETNPDGAYLWGVDSAGGDQPHFNAQPYYAVTYIIYAGSV